MIHAFLRWYAGGYYRLCEHKSHRLHLSCFRPFTADGYCARHNDEWYRDEHNDYLAKRAIRRRS